MSWFDREEVETALKAGRISVDEDTISNFDKWLYITEPSPLPPHVQHYGAGTTRLPSSSIWSSSLENSRCDGPTLLIER